MHFFFTPTPQFSIHCESSRVTHRAKLAEPWHNKGLICTNKVNLILMTTIISGRPKPEICFLPRRLRWRSATAIQLWPWIEHPTFQLRVELYHRAIAAQCNYKETFFQIRSLWRDFQRIARAKRENSKNQRALTYGTLPQLFVVFEPVFTNYVVSGKRWRQADKMSAVNFNLVTCYVKARGQGWVALVIAQLIDDISICHDNTYTLLKTFEIHKFNILCTVFSSNLFQQKKI